MAEIEIHIKTDVKTVMKILKKFFAVIFIIVFSTNLLPKNYEKLGDFFLQNFHTEVSAEKSSEKPKLKG